MEQHLDHQSLWTLQEWQFGNTDNHIIWNSLKLYYIHTSNRHKSLSFHWFIAATFRIEIKTDCTQSNNHCTYHYVTNSLLPTLQYLQSFVY